MENNFIVFCNVDEDGNIYDGVVGNNIVPNKQYEYFFYLGEEGIDDLLKYKVINGELTKIAEGSEESEETSETSEEKPKDG